MAPPRVTPGPADPAADLGFLLSQIGSHWSTKFAGLLEPLGLKLPHAGILRVIEQADGLSQTGVGRATRPVPESARGVDRTSWRGSAWSSGGAARPIGGRMRST